MATDRVHVHPGSALLNWRALESYPDDENARGIGALCRSAMNMMFIHPLYQPNAWWPDYFWNRGLELEPCTISDGSAS